jgi:hypothetical protein
VSYHFPRKAKSCQKSWQQDGKYNLLIQATPSSPPQSSRHRVGCPDVHLKTNKHRDTYLCSRPGLGDLSCPDVHHGENNMLPPPLSRHRVGCPDVHLETNKHRDTYLCSHPCLGLAAQTYTATTTCSVKGTSTVVQAWDRQPRRTQQKQNAPWQDPRPSTALGA